nr:E-beta-farnesene synthase [Tanacetum cinerariifolium]
MSRHTTGKKNASLILIPSIRFTKLIIHHLQMRHKFHSRPDSLLHLSDDEPVLGYLKFSAKGTKREVFRMPIPSSLITVDIREASYYQEYQENVAKHKRFMAGETGSAQGSPIPKPAKHARKPKPAAQKAPPRPLVSTPVASAQPAPTSAPAKPQENKRKQVTKTTDKPAKAKRIKHSATSKTRKPKSSPKYVAASKAEEVPTVEPQVADEDSDYQKALEESMKAAYALPRGPLPPVVIREPESEKYQPLLEVPGKGKAKVTEEQVAHDLLSLQKAKKKSPSDSEEESKKVVLGATEGGNDEDQVRPDPRHKMKARREQARTDADTLDEGQAGSNPDEMSEGLAGPDPGNAGNEEQSIPSHVVHTGSDREHIDLDVTDVSHQPSMEQLDEGFLTMAYPKIQECLKLAVEEQVLLEEPASSSGTHSSLHHLSRDISFGDQFFSNKPSDANKYAETKVESMVNVPIQQALSSISPMASPIIDLTSRPVSPKVHQQFKATTTDTTITTTTTTVPPPTAQQQSSTEAMMIKRIGELEHIMADLLKVNKDMEARLDKHGARLYMLEELDIPEQVSKARLTESRYKRDPSSSHVGKRILQSHEDHMQLFEALEKSMNHDHYEELAQDLAEARKKKKKSRESPKTPPGSPPHQPPPLPPPTGPFRASRAPGASGSSQSPPPHPPPSTNIESAHIPKVNLRQDWWKPLEEERIATPEPAWSIPSFDAPVTQNNWASALVSDYSPPPEDSLLTQTDDMATFIDCVDDSIHRNNVSKPLPIGGPPGQVTIQSEFFFNKDLEYLRYGSKGNRTALSISKLKVAYYPDAGLEQMVSDQFWIDEECKYDIAAMYGISHWWFQRQRFYIDRHTSEVLRRADLNEHVIAERDFKYLYPSDFEDLYLLNLQGHLNHLPPKDKKILTTVVNQWIRQPVIRQRVEDFQLGIESYQTQLNLTKPQWDATGFEYKHDYTVIDSPRAVIFLDKYGVQMMMRFHEIHKFSDGTLQQIDEALDYRVKEFRINRMNPGLNTRFWTRKDVDRCKAFMFAIQRRLRTMRIFRNLKIFVGGRLREGDYRLLKYTE